MNRQDTLAFSDDEDASKVWGRLVSLSSKVKNLSLVNDEYTFGRSATNSVSIPDKRLSGTHSKISKEGGKIMLTDLSTNGTFFDDEKMGKGATKELKSGSKFYLLHPSKVSEDDVIGYIFANPNEDISKLKRDREETKDSKAADDAQKASKLTDDMGEEIQCSICIDYVYQCVTTLPCLHNFCGACLSDWTKKSKDCPQCRDSINEVKKNASINNLVSKLLAAHPDKKRSQPEYDLMNKENTFTQDRTIFKTETSSVGAPKKKAADEDKGQNKCAECRVARRSDGFKCDRNQAHLACTACKGFYPDRRSTHPQECTICAQPYCNLYFTCPARRGDNIQELQNHGVEANLQDDIFNGNKTEAKILREYLIQEKMNCKTLLQNFLKDNVDKNQFKYKANKSIMIKPPTASFEVALQRTSPVCNKCFDHVWYQIVFRYRQSIKNELPAKFKSRGPCWYGINCKTMTHNKDHAEKLDHVVEQTKF